MRVLLVHNPASGDGSIDGDELCEVAAAEGHDVRYATTDDDWTTELSHGVDLVAAAGGDGTVREVVLRLRGGDVPAAIIPLGTANNIARAIGLPVGAPLDAVRGWRPGGSVCRLDVPVVRAPDGGTCFLEALGGGLFGELLRRADAAEEAGATDGGLDDARRMLIELLRTHPSAHRWGIRVDGEDVSGDFTAVELVNTGLVGPRVGMSTRSDPGDGMLEVVAIDPAAHATMADRLQRADQEEVVRFDAVRWRGRTVELVPPPDATLHVDDEVVAERTDGSWGVTLRDGDRVRILC